MDEQELYSQPEAGKNDEDKAASLWIETARQGKLTESITRKNKGILKEEAGKAIIF